MDHPIVTVVVSTYNARHLIRGCLEDLIRQTISSDLEIIVVDSASETKEHEIVIPMQDLHPGILCLRTARRENSHAAYNRALRLATGRYMTVANTDDRHRPDALEKMATLLDAQADVALVYADTLRTNVLNETYEEALQRSRPVVRWPDYRPHRLFGNARIGPQPMWRRSLHQEIGSFDGSLVYAGDYDFWLRIAARTTYRLHHLGEVLGLWYDAPTTLSQANVERVREEVEVIRQKYREPLVAAGKLHASGAPLIKELEDIHLQISGKRIALFGAGEFGDLVFEILANQRRTMVAFIDNDPRKQGGLRKGLPILSPELAIRNRVADIILVASMYWAEISEQLMSLGLRPDTDFAVCYC